MQARTLAIIILIVLLGVPIFLYWYFFTQKIASVTIEAGEGIPFTLDLRGTLSSSWLPLADKFLEFHENCTASCRISPIPPVKYSLVITSTGRVDIHDEIVLGTGESKTRTYTLNQDLQIQESTGMISDKNLGISLVENANNTLSGSFTLVGVGDKNRVYAVRRKDNQSQLGILFLDKFIPLRTLGNEIQDLILDITGRFFLASLSSQKTLIFSINMDKEVEVPLHPLSAVYMNDTWKIQTASGSYIYDNYQIQENPRFTDFLDISPSTRIGYIDKDDSNRLSLSNFPIGESVLVFLDRTTGRNYIVKKGLDVQTLFLQGEKPVYIDSLGKVWEIENKP